MRTLKEIIVSLWLKVGDVIYLKRRYHRLNKYERNDSL
nr:MAG TPA: penicillin-binding protein [Caudoviricetes sp.]